MTINPVLQLTGHRRHMHISKFRVSSEATRKLKALQQRTGLTPNLLCRMAMVVSFEAGKIGTVPDTEESYEFNAYSIFGSDQPIYTTLLLWVETQGGETLEDQELVKRLRAHVDRGLGAISVRLKSPSDVARMLAREVRG